MDHCCLETQGERTPKAISSYDEELTILVQ